MKQFAIRDLLESTDEFDVVFVDADALRVPASKVTRALSLLDLPPHIQQRIDAGEIAARTGYELSKASDKSQQIELAKQAAAGALSTVDAAESVRNRSRSRKSATRGTRQVFVADNGIRVTVTNRSKVTYEQIEQALLTALEEVRPRIKSGLTLY
jgi:ParB-like chromosome segregation protein Spo0J